MKNCRVLRTGLAAFLVVALSAACIPGALAYSQENSAQGSANARENSAKATSASDTSTATFEKSEVVYASLASDGAPEDVYVVNRFEVERAGSITDFGAYSAVQNLTDGTALTNEDGQTSFEVGEGVFSYQGTMVNQMLPWNIDIAYELDGRNVSAGDLAGASGLLSIHLSTAQNKQVDEAIYKSFMMQITFTLPQSACSDVVADGATIATAGEDTTVAFTVLPGHDGDFTLSAEVENFTMDGVQIAALPYAQVMEMPDTDAMVDDMTELSDAVSQLTQGTESLAAGIDELTSGAQSLSSGTAAFGDGLRTLDGSSTLLVNSSSQIKGALSDIAAGFSGADFSSLENLGQLPATLRTLAAGLDTLQANVSQVQAGYSQALIALDSAIKAIPSDVTSDEIAALKASVTSDQEATVNKLVTAYQAAQTVKATYGNGAVFDGAGTLLATLAAGATTDGSLAQQAAALRQMADQLEASLDMDALKQLPALVSGLSQLSSQYGQFHEGLSQYASGLSALSANYTQIESGVGQFAGGTEQVASGANELSGGMGELNEATITLPDTMREEIDSMMADYDFPEFEPTSFVSEKNMQTTSMQFVMATPAIDAPEEEIAEEPEYEPTLWERFLALFQM